MASSDGFRITPRLCRAARALTAWRQQDLADRSGVPLPTIMAFETKPESARVATLNNKALVGAFEAAGVEFIPENGGGAGVRLRKAAE